VRVFFFTMSANTLDCEVLINAVNPLRAEHKSRSVPAVLSDIVVTDKLERL